MVTASNIDSLYAVWKNTNNADSVRIGALRTYIWKGVLWSSPDSAYMLSKRGYELAKESGNHRYSALMLNIQGVYHSNRGSLSQAMNSFSSCLKIYQDMGDTLGISTSYNNIGLVFQQSQEVGKAADYFTKSYEMYEQLGDESGMATAYNNLGLCFFAKNEYKIALGYFKVSLEMAERLGEKDSKSDYSRNIGYVYLNIGNYEKALSYFKETLELDKELNNTTNIATSYRNLGQAYRNLGKLDESEEYGKKAMSLAKEIDYLRMVLETSEDLYKLYKLIGNYKESLAMLQQFKNLKDSVGRQINARSNIEQQFKFDYEMKQELDNARHDEQLKVSAEKEKRKELISYAVGSGLLIMLVFSYLIFKRLRLTDLQKEIIEEQKKDITDSINYAKRIQDAMLPKQELINDLLPANFVLFQPKDIVSGDFYWVGKQGDYIFFAVCDCTGHGIPGAFMSMIGTVLLNEIILIDGETSTKKILDRMRLQIIHSLNQKGKQGESKDGMDMMLCRYDEKNEELLYTGAYSTLLYVSDGVLVVLKGDRRPVGYFKGMDIAFTEHRIKVKQRDCLYLFSDGYPDQFGGKKNKKYKLSRLIKLINSESDKTMADQKAILESTLKEWRGDLEQVDDVCVMGIRI